MRLLVISIFVFISLNLLPQSSTYQKLDIQESKSNNQLEEYSIEAKFKFYTYFIQIGQSNSGYKLFITNQEDSILFRFKGPEDSYIMDPSFYRSNSQTDPKIILVESGSEYTWGNHVILFEKNEIKEIGHLNYGVINMYNPVSFVDDLEIKSSDGIVYFTIDAKEIIFDPGGAKERSILNQKIIYTYENGVFQKK